MVCILYILAMILKTTPKFVIIIFILQWWKHRIREIQWLALVIQEACCYVD